MNSNSIKTVRDFLKYLQSERFHPTGELHGKQIGYAKREPVSILDMEEFIKEKTEYDPRKLKALKQDVQFYIYDEELEAEAINEETKRNSNDEFFLCDRASANRIYKKALEKLSDIGKLRVRVILKWIKLEKISDNELDLREQFNDDIVDAVAAKQGFDRLIPGEGIYYPDTSKLYSFLQMIEYQIEQVENKDEKSTWDKIPDDFKEEKKSGSLRPVDWDYIDKRMKELIESGESMNAASEIVEKEIKSVRKAGSIRNWYGKTNENWAN